MVSVFREVCVFKEVSVFREDVCFSLLSVLREVSVLRVVLHLERCSIVLKIHGGFEKHTESSL